MRPRRLRSYDLLLVVLTLSFFVGVTGCSSPENRAIGVLRSPNAATDAQLSAVRQLQSLGKDALLNARPELLQLLRTTSPDLRRAVEEALVVVGPETAGDLINTSEDPSRLASVLRILRRTKVDDSQIQRISTASVNGNEAKRLHATELLGALGIKNSSAVVQLQRLMSDQDPLVRIAAINEASDAEPLHSSALVPLLIRLLDDDTIGVREAACVGLGNIGPPAIDAKSALERLANERGTRLAELAQIALSNIAGTTPDHLNANAHGQQKVCKRR
jgi:HEAT repeat protein